MKKQTKRTKKVLTVTGVSVASLLVIGCIGALMLGYVTITFSGSPRVASGTVCGDELIASYNTAYSEQDTAKIAETISSVEKKDGFDKDPTCLFMQAQGYATLGNRDKATSAYNALKQHADRGEYVSPKLDSLVGIETLNQNVVSDSGAISGY